MTDSASEKIDLAIIGGGPAGLTAAIYGCRAGLSTIVFSSAVPGSQLLKTDALENFPGFPEPVSGYDLLEKMQRQAVRLGAEVREDEIVEADIRENTANNEPEPDASKTKLFCLKTDSGKTIKARAVIIASGAVPRMLGLADEQRLLGRGVSYCAVCDGFFFRRKPVAVIGGGDTAVGEALYLAKLASEVYLVHRRSELRAAASLAEKVFASKNIKLELDSNVVAIKGENSVEGISVKNSKTGIISEIPVSGVFIAIGQTPSSALFAGQLEISPSGIIKTDNRCRSSVPGVFAAGDVADPLYRQAIVAAASGAKAAMEAAEYLKEIH